MKVILFKLAFSIEQTFTPLISHILALYTTKTDNNNNDPLLAL